MRICDFDKSKHMARLRECAIELQDFERTLDPRLPTGKSIVDEYIPRMFYRCTQCDGKILIAEVDGEVAGYAMILTRVSSDEIEDANIEYGLIADLIVSKKYRGRGYGRQLLEAAEAFAKERDVGWLRIGVLSRNAGAQNMYAQMGFSQIYVEREKDLRE